MSHDFRFVTNKAPAQMETRFFIKLLQEHAKTTEKEMQNLLARVPGIGTIGPFEGWMAVADIL